MGLSGNFKETAFADLLQFYSVSKQTVAVTVRLGVNEHVDGVFYFSDGDLVGAALGGSEGREAVRRALRLRDGSFSVELGAKPAGSASREALRNVVMEEVVRLDEENRAAGVPSTVASGPAKHSGAVAAGAGWWAAPDTAARPPAAKPPPPTPTPVPAVPDGLAAAQAAAAEAKAQALEEQLVGAIRRAADAEAALEAAQAPTPAPGADPAEGLKRAAAEKDALVAQIAERDQRITRLQREVADKTDRLGRLAKEMGELKAKGRGFFG